MEEPRRLRFEHCVDERFLHDRIAELDGPRLPSTDGFLRQIDARKRDAVDSVSSGVTATQDEDIPHLANSISLELGALREPDASDVHDDVPEVALVELDAPRHRRYPQAVPIVADPRHDAAENGLPVIVVPRALCVRID